eukprot:scaffold55309_cov36-Phaeocystis_antarctica.AAC.1
MAAASRATVRPAPAAHASRSAPDGEYVGWLTRSAGPHTVDTRWGHAGGGGGQQAARLASIRWKWSLGAGAGPVDGASARSRASAWRVAGRAARTVASRACVRPQKSCSEPCPALGAAGSTVGPARAPAPPGRGCGSSTRARGRCPPHSGRTRRTRAAGKCGTRRAALGWRPGPPVRVSAHNSRERCRCQGRRARSSCSLEGRTVRAPRRRALVRWNWRPLLGSGSAATAVAATVSPLAVELST